MTQTRFLERVTDISAPSKINEADPTMRMASIDRTPISYRQTYLSLFYLAILSTMHLMYYLDDSGKRVYTLKVRTTLAIRLARVFVFVRPSHKLLARRSLYFHNNRKKHPREKSRSQLIRLVSHQMINLVHKE